jgi:hypothetical protein
MSDDAVRVLRNENQELKEKLAKAELLTETQMSSLLELEQKVSIGRENRTERSMNGQPSLTGSVTRSAHRCRLSMATPAC